MRRILVGGLALTLLAAACSSGDGGDSSAEDSAETTETTLGLGPALEVDDSPLPVLTVAEDIAPSGFPLRPSASFPDTAPQITAVAFAQAAGTATLTWSQVPDEGDPEELFSHEVVVEAGQVGFSKGASPGVLTAGTYRVEASLGDDEEVAEFVVEAPAPAGGGEAGGAAGRAAQDPGTAGPPQSGESGAVDYEEIRGTPHAFFELHTPDLKAAVIQAEIPFFGVTEVEVTVTGPGGTVTKTFAPRGGGNVVSIDLDPCRVGSDLPGTATEWSLVAVGGEVVLVTPDVELLEMPPSVTVTLDSDRTRPAVGPFDTGPRPGSSVAPGDTIGFDVIARDQKREGSSWQTGVQLLQVLADDELVDDKEGPSRPPKCDEGKRVLNLQGEYEVPDDPPPIIKLCAVAEDYAGNVGTKCHEYYTGEVWKGTFTYDYSPISCSTAYDITLAVRDGEVLGSVTITSNTCGGSPFSADEITGKKTDESFTLGFFGGAEAPIPIRDGRATATFSSDPSVEHRALDIRCVTCDR